ncbi:tryptophan---tRNA ligase [Spizellomyces sp. 'palustris']|nr:tryptophan---tRNA ligase [Spizellomyces sp. 'palustris']
MVRNMWRPSRQRSLASKLSSRPLSTVASPKPSRFRPCTLSGIQPTGVPHLGNYLGALANWVRLQDSRSADSHVLYSIVDLHALTVPQDPIVLRRNVRDMAASLLACGIDPKRSVLFRQSKVPQHSELAWLLFCRTPIGWLSRMHQWKSKLQMLQQNNPNAAAITTANATISLMSGGNEDAKLDGDENIQGLNIGLLAYPVLQAADILIYRATEVPIGEDQLQHLELTVMAARSLNSHYKKEIFPIPKGIFASSSSKRIMSLRAPTSKMSKSDPSDASRINLDDTPDQIRSKIRKATVDSSIGITYDPINRPGVANLINIYSSFSKEEVAQVAARFATSGNKDFKEAVAERVIEGLKPIREELLRLRKDMGFVEGILSEGEERARHLASRTLRDVQKVIGLI